MLNGNSFLVIRNIGFCLMCTLGTSGLSFTSISDWGIQSKPRFRMTTSTSRHGMATQLMDLVHIKAQVHKFLLVASFMKTALPKRYGLNPINVARLVKKICFVKMV